jgi:hypothetical protein
MSKPFSSDDTYYKNLDDFLKLLRATTLVNTWHTNEVESAAMWHLYSNNNAGIAIQSTYERLSESFNNNKEDPVWISTVRYIYYNKDMFGLANTFEAFTCKRLSFQHENELRAFTSLLGHRFMESLLDQSKKVTRLHWPKKQANMIEKLMANMFLLKLDLLIERIYLSPSSQDWHIDLFKSIKSKLYSLH